MPYFEGKFVMINRPDEAHLLEVAITAALKHWRTDHIDVSEAMPLLTRIQSELHAVADKETLGETIETGARHASNTTVSQEQRPASLTTYEAAKRLNVSVQMIRRYCGTDQLTATRRGKRSWQIDPRSVEEMEQAQ